MFGSQSSSTLEDHSRAGLGTVLSADGTVEPRLGTWSIRVAFLVRNNIMSTAL
jgi:hypothetical protein